MKSFIFTHYTYSLIYFVKDNSRFFRLVIKTEMLLLQTSLCHTGSDVFLLKHREELEGICSGAMT